MAIQLEEINLSKFILVGDRILIKPRSKQDRTKTGLLLPPTVQENEKVQSGYVVKVGPGMPVPMVNDEDEPWKGSQDKVKYIPLQAQEGDLAVYMQNNVYEITFNEETYIIAPQSAILLLIRDESLFI
jgi:co-chaperonin GroES (HSP10)